MKSAAGVVPIFAFLLLAGCGGGGGGGATSDPPRRFQPQDFETREYRTQGGLGLIKASSMYARGGTGRGVTVAVLDTGATPSHPDLNYNEIEHKDGTDGIDSRGHGTQVAGIAAAARNGIGMHGVAFEAEIASWKIRDDTDMVPELQEYLERVVEAIGEVNALEIGVVNNSWGIPLEHVNDPAELSGFRLAAAEYIDNGGVLVWAAGNTGGETPEFPANMEPGSLEDGIDEDWAGLEQGWLAVVATDLDGEATSYSEKCGDASRWCIAAPGGADEESEETSIRTTTSEGDVCHTCIDIDGEQYAYGSGTSFAAPQVVGALAALKSMFPNLGYQQIRDRILETADSSGRYADERIYGQGLLDLDAASRPIGGASFALSAHDHGPVVSTVGARLTLPAGAFASYLAGEDILILDNYQRAPFLVPMGLFARESEGGYLRLRDLGLDRDFGFSASRRDSALSELTAAADERDGWIERTLAGSGFRVEGVSDGVRLFGAGAGAEVMRGFTEFAGLPGAAPGDYRMSSDAVGIAFGLDSGRGEFHASAATSVGESGGGVAADPGFGIRGWAPGSVIAASFVPRGSSYAFGASFASDLKRPSGWDGSGAFALTGDSLDFTWGRVVFAGESAALGVTGRVAHLALEDAPLASFEDALVASAGLDLRFGVSRDVTLRARLGVERAIGAGEGTLRVARTIDESGRIGYDDIRIDQSDLLEFESAGLGVHHAPAPGLRYGAGVAAVRDGFGRTEAIIGVRTELRY